MKGFTVIELLMYVLIFSILITITLRYMVYSFLQLDGQSNKIYKTIQLCAAHAQMTRDLQAAPAGINDWYRYDDDIVCWHDIKHDIAWAVEGGSLIRRYGHYDCKKKRWISKHTNLAMRNVKHLVCQLIWMKAADGKQQIRYISIKIESIVEGSTFAWTIMPNRRVL